MKYLTIIILALSIQAKGEMTPQAAETLRWLADKWSEPRYYNNYDYSPPEDSFGPYKQYMQRQQELQTPPVRQAPQKEFCISRWVYSDMEGRYIPVGCE